jgi:adenosine deaminase
VQITDTFGLTADDIEKLARNSFEAAFMDDVAQAQYLDRFKAEVSKLRAEIFD